jgi:hypothetical protein
VSSNFDAKRLLISFATCDLPTVRRLCAPDVVIYGTEQGEYWDNLDEFCVALEAMRALGLAARWKERPVDRGGWIAGVAIYTTPGQGDVPVRVTLILQGAKVVHGHFSIVRMTAPAGVSSPTKASGG